MSGTNARSPGSNSSSTSFTSTSWGSASNDLEEDQKEWWREEPSETPVQDRTCPPAVEMSDSASEGSELGFDEPGETPEEKEERELKEEQALAKARALEKAKALEAAEAKAKLERIKKQEIKRKQEEQEAIRQKEKLHENDLKELLDSISNAEKEILKAKKPFEYQNLSTEFNNVDDEGVGLYHLIRKFSATQKSTLNSNELLQVAAAVSQFIAVNEDAKTKDIDELLYLGALCYQELTKTRVKVEEDAGNNVLLASYFHIHYDFLRNSRLAQNLLVRRADEDEVGHDDILHPISTTDNLLGRLRKLLFKITRNKENSNSNKSKKDKSKKNVKEEQALALQFLCHELTYRVKQSQKPVPDFSGALNSLKECQSIKEICNKKKTKKNPTSPLHPALMKLQFFLNNDSASIAYSLNNKRADNALNLSKDQLLLKNKIKRMEAYIKDRRKNRLKLDRVINDAFRSLWKNRKDMIRHAEAIIECDGHQIDDSMKDLTLSFERLMKIDLAMLIAVGTKLKVFQVYINNLQDTDNNSTEDIDVHNRKELIEQIIKKYSVPNLEYESDGQGHFVNIKEEVRDLLGMTDGGSGFTPWGVNYADWKLP